VAGHAARHTADVAKRTATEIAEEAKAVGRDVAHSARSQVTSVVRSQIERACAEVDHVGNALERAAEHLRTEADPRLASYAGTAARALHGTAGYLRTKGFAAVVEDVARVARRRPEVFVGGLLLCGFAVGRFLRASDAHEADEAGDGHSLDPIDEENRFSEPSLNEGRTPAHDVSAASSPDHAMGDARSAAERYGDRGYDFGGEETDR
jgi:hypothetical protein